MVMLRYGRFNRNIKICDICVINLSLMLLDGELVHEHFNCSSIVEI
jgi:hypothetical protein